MKTIDNVKDVLVVRQHNQIGDMLCSLTLYAAIKKKYPSAHITLVAAKTNYQIPFFDINPYLDRVLVFDKSTLKKLLYFIKQLRNRKYQIGVVPSTIVISRTSHIINWFSGAKLRIGARSIDGVLNESQKYLNIKSDFNWKDKHQTIRNLEVIEQIGCELSKTELEAIKFKFSEDEISFAENFLIESFPDHTKKTIAFHPGAGKKANIWPANKFIELIIRLYSKYQNNILITSGWTDGPIIENISSELSSSGIPFKVLHNLEVLKLGAVLGKVDLYITNDTGTMHIAGYSDAKMISLFGPTNPKEWAPLGKYKASIKSLSDKIEDIDTDTVFNKAIEIIEND